MAVQNITHKNIKPQFIAIRPMHLYKEWRLNSYDFALQQNLKKFMSASAVSVGYVGDLNTYYNSYFTGSIPNFPPLNAKYARLYPNETGSGTEPDGGGPLLKVVDDDGYLLSYNYLLGNGDKFYPTYQSSSVLGGVNPDGTYARMVHYSLQRLFYGDDGVYKNLFFSTSSYLSNEAFVIEIPQRYVADTIEPGTFVLRETSNIYNLPYTTSGSSNGYTPYDNTPATNSLASDGIRLVDDSRGNLFDTNYTSSGNVGNIFYEMGLVIITDQVYAKYFREYTIVSGSFI